MDALQYAFPRVVAVEGGWDRNTADRGNWTSGIIGRGELRGTKFGISAMAYPTLDIGALTRDAALMLYRHDYFDKICGDQLPPQLAVLVFDAAVNQGVGAAVRMLQESVGAEPDGVLGPRTLQAVRARGNDCRSLVLEYAARRMLRYGSTGTFPTFGLGWARRLFTMTNAALEYRA